MGIIIASIALLIALIWWMHEDEDSIPDGRMYVVAGCYSIFHAEWRGDETHTVVGVYSTMNAARKAAQWWVFDNPHGLVEVFVTESDPLKYKWFNCLT